MPQDIVRVLRLIEYEGPRDLVEKQVKDSLHGTRTGIRDKENNSVRITAVTLDTFPQVLEEARQIPCPAEMTKLRTDLERTQDQLTIAHQLINQDETESA
jgi:hypothetical protein